MDRNLVCGIVWHSMVQYGMLMGVSISIIIIMSRQVSIVAWYTDKYADTNANTSTSTKTNTNTNTNANTKLCRSLSGQHSITPSTGASIRASISIIGGALLVHRYLFNAAAFASIVFSAFNLPPAKKQLVLKTPCVQVVVYKWCPWHIAND